MNTLEAVVLTGGSSRRMGADKAKLPVHGVPMAERIVQLLTAAGIPVTILGKEPIGGASFLKDKEESGGPIAALAAFKPQADYVFVASCDLPRFDSRIVAFLRQRIGDADACAPQVDGFRQPLCALYAKSAFDRLATLEDQCAMGWLKALRTTIVPESDLIEAGLKPSLARGANTPEELAAALAEVSI
jgi:molybdopterin-guanine dinucleotide biosynthesis protein A